MTTPWPRNPEFTGLRNAIVAAAARVLEDAHPDHAVRFREAVGQRVPIGQALDVAGALPADSPFGPWRRILTSFTEIEMSTVQVQTALYLMRTSMLPELQDAVGAAPGSWVVYHAQAALNWLAAVAEGARRLVGMIYRTCVRPTDLDWNTKSALAARPLSEIAGRIEAMRQRLADDGWTARELEREGLWDGIVLAPRWLRTAHIWHYAAQFRKLWFRELDALARGLIFTMERTAARLLAEVHWEALG